MVKKGNIKYQSADFVPTERTVPSLSDKNIQTLGFPAAYPSPKNFLLKIPRNKEIVKLQCNKVNIKMQIS